MALTIDLDQHDNAAKAVVELCEGDVQLTLLGEDEGELDTWRALKPAEARALAAALCHYAAEAER